MSCILSVITNITEVIMDTCFSGKQLDKQVPIPFYSQLKELLLDIISISTEYTLKLTESQFCKRFLISRVTVRQGSG